MNFCSTNLVVIHRRNFWLKRLSSKSIKTAALFMFGWDLNFFIDQTSRAIKKDITSEFKGQGLVLFCFPKGINFTKATISHFLVSKKTKVLLSLLKSLFFCSFLKSNNFLFLWMIQGVRPLLFFSKSHHCSQKFSVVLKNFHCLQKLCWTYQPFLNWSFWLNWQLHLEEK